MNRWINFFHLNTTGILIWQLKKLRRRSLKSLFNSVTWVWMGIWRWASGSKFPLLTVKWPCLISHLTLSVTPRMTASLRIIPTLHQEWTPQKPCVQLAPPQDRIAQVKVGTWPQVIHSDSSPAPIIWNSDRNNQSAWISLLCWENGSAGTTRCLPPPLRSTQRQKMGNDWKDTEKRWEGGIS